jgi:hypothetical protein
MFTLRGNRTNTWLAAAGFFVLMLSAGVASAEPLPNVSICHQGNVIVVNANSLPAHLAHGDTLGTCAECDCPTTIEPVLCTTGNTYDNLCRGRCAGEECYYIDNAVICDPTAGCTGGPLFAPVICPNGASYVNAALASCCLNGQTAGCRDGACLFSCPTTANPTTCANGKTYQNSCYATCDGATGCAP